MSSFLKTSFIAVLFSSASITAFAGNKGNENPDDTLAYGLDVNICLELTISTTFNNNLLSGVTIKIYHDNSLVSTIDNELVSIQKLSLRRNNHYAVEVSKKGYFSKLISISTEMPVFDYDDNKKAYKYDLKIDMVKSNSEVESYYLDFPIALIAYDQNTDQFTYSHKYSDEIVKEINKEIGTTFSGDFDYK